MVNLSVKIGSLELKNPVMTASGTFGYGQEYSELIDIEQLGAIVVKGLSYVPKQGNPPPRITETPAGMLNAIGLQNIGVEKFITEKLPYLQSLDTKIIANFFGDSVDEYVMAAKALTKSGGIHALEMNISCPNKQAGWIVFGTDPDAMRQVVTAVRSATDLPLIVKLSPNVTDIGLMAKVAEDCGADAVSLINTITGMCIDTKSRKSKIANVTGGLSGPAIRPIAVRMVWEVNKSVMIPIIGMGGIMTAQDALEFIIAGASSVSVGTANFINPKAAIEIISGITDYLLEQGVTDINEIIGSLKT
ncbi:MAG: dihydroorotate dehydrogenase [Dissulfurispiraceae bacterium]|jgi:dihydroorotate dehydrogenase (NAD+) catalytic subunit|nr:dihydroorotate dehydrogenase [Dissulfurispiraceae bacterium]